MRRVIGLGAQLEHKPEIDGLRAIAVAAVVAYHAFPAAVPGGFVGVDIFFVISGYLITSLLVRERADTGRVDFFAFYARRMRRLLPALVAMLVGVMLLLVVLMGRHERLASDAASSSLWSLLFAANLHFQATVGGYFDAAADTRPMLHLWSLAVEEQYYLIYPWLLVALLARVSAAPGRWLAGLASASFVLSEYWANVEPGMGFYQMPSRFWELAAGGLVALSPTVPAGRRSLPGLLPAGLALVLLACACTGRWGAFPGKAALPVVAGTAMVLLAIHRGAVAGPGASLLRSRPLVALGLVSYSLYLWHWPLLVMAQQARIEPAGPGLRVAACALALLLAILSWRFVETPVRRWRIRNPVRWLGAGVLATMVAGGAIIGLSRLDRVPAEARRISAFTRNDMPAINDACRFDQARTVDVPLPDHCNSRPAQVPTFALWGDSHAMAWQPFAWRLAEAADASAAALTLNSCAPAKGRVDPGQSANCERFNRQAMEWLARQPLDTIMIAQRWPRALSADASVPAHLASRLDALAFALEELRHVRRVIVIGPLPTARRAAPDCIALGWERECGIPRALHGQRAAPAWRRLEALALRYPNVVLLDPADYFCDTADCPPTRDGVGLYWDDNHVTASAARGFAAAYLADPRRYTRLAREGMDAP